MCYVYHWWRDYKNAPLFHFIYLVPSRPLTCHSRSKLKKIQYTTMPPRIKASTTGLLMTLTAVALMLKPLLHNLSSPPLTPPHSLLSSNQEDHDISQNDNANDDEGDDQDLMEGNHEDESALEMIQPTNLEDNVNDDEDASDDDHDKDESALETNEPPLNLENDSTLEMTEPLLDLNSFDKDTNHDDTINDDDSNKFDDDNDSEIETMYDDDHHTDASSLDTIEPPLHFKSNDNDVNHVNGINNDLVVILSKIDNPNPTVSLKKEESSLGMRKPLISHQELLEDMSVDKKETDDMSETAQPEMLVTPSQESKDEEQSKKKDDTSVKTSSTGTKSQVQGFVSFLLIVGCCVGSLAM